MRRSSRRKLLAAGIVSAAMAVFTGGCSKDNQSMLFVRGVLAWPSGQCVVTADPSSAMRLGGTLDLAFGRGEYTAPLLIGNQLVTRGNRDRLRTESSRVALRGAVVTIRDITGNKLAEYTTDGTGFVDPGSGDQPGYGIMSVQMIPPGLNPKTGQLDVAVRVFGETLGGEDVESSELTFPITVCSGCLISFPNEAIVPATGQCAGGELPTDPAPCVVGQDDPIDCRYCAAQNALCLTPK